MKSITTLITVFLFTYSLNAQESNFLFGGEATSISGFGGIMSEISLAKSEPIYMVGGGGGMLVNNQFFLGGYGMGNVVDDEIFAFNNMPARFEIGHGGLWVGGIFMPERIVHFGASGRFGWGGIGLTDTNGNRLLNDDIFVVSPQAEVEVNVLPFMKLNIAAGYRATLGVNNAFFDMEDLSKPYGLVGLYFGWFDN